MCVFLFVHSRYKQDFLKAYYTFQYQIVFDPVTKTQRPLTNPPKGFKVEDHSYLGRIDPNHDSVLQKALGLRNPISDVVVNLSLPPNYDPFSFVHLRKAENNPKALLSRHIETAALYFHSKR